MESKDSIRNKRNIVASSPCRHGRLLERTQEENGAKGNMMKCCECGALIPRPSHKISHQ